MDPLATKSIRKKNGVHYTPKPFADFLASQIWNHCHDALRTKPNLRILDPACGAGQLLTSMIEQVAGEAQIEVIGYEIDGQAAEHARRQLDGHFVQAKIIEQDFFEATLENPDPEFDLVITNPPYVRTQNLGAETCHALKERFGLTGRLDLYQAFTFACTRKILPGGILGLLTSNRFMSVQSGAMMRRVLLTEYDLKAIFDFGDTRMFSASVLPVVVIGNRNQAIAGTARKNTCVYKQVYETKLPNNCSIDSNDQLFSSVVDADKSMVVQSKSTSFRIEVGRLNADESGKASWTLSNEESETFFRQLAVRQEFVFEDVADIKVGIKTTADPVFIRDDWNNLPNGCFPEPELLKPLITHHVASRWQGERPRTKVLYPYQNMHPRTCVDLNLFPYAKSYLYQYQTRLSSRNYVIKAGRQWFEIWVPQQPVDWLEPKIVWPDIAQQPTFFLDDSGSIVNGDCYWIKLKPRVDPDWLYMILAVANSSLAVQFYDQTSNNKLYAGRRRFMTQYVKLFPLPELKSEAGGEIVEKVKQMIHKPVSQNDETEIDELVCRAFGFPGSVSVNSV